MVRINPPTNIKCIQFLGSPFRGKNFEEYKKRLLEEKLEKISREYPLIPYVRASRLYSTVRRMKAEKEMNIPVNLRAGFAISTELGNRANEMAEEEWEKFYEQLSNELRADYPDIHAHFSAIFGYNPL